MVPRNDEAPDSNHRLLVGLEFVRPNTPVRPPSLFLSQEHVLSHSGTFVRHVRARESSSRDHTSRFLALEDFVLLEPCQAVAGHSGTG